ncbi:MAG: HAD family hydrolase [Chloroflexota bacterium]|jgi:beta-phosphoglucomutase-like phosphatase (HAD superfamily)|nr:HAD family hydrolase [Chloroflexota bacterium]
MTSAAPPPAIIFDLDGTLVDTVGARIGAWEAVFAEFRIPIACAPLGPMIGMDGRRLAADVASAAGMPIDAATAEAIDRRAGSLFEQRNRNPQPLPGARAALAMLDRAGVTWAIATSSRAEQVTASIGAMELAHNPRIVDGGAVEHAKPAPDLLLLAARQVGMKPDGCWYVGDSTWDMGAAVAANMLPIGVLAGAAVGEKELRDAGAAVIWRTLDDLRRLGWD